MSIKENYVDRSIYIHPLVTFRILFGLLMAYGGIRFLLYGWVDKLYIEPEFFFKFYGFEWIDYVGDSWIYPVFYIMIISSFCIALGLFYKLSAALFFLSFTYIELLDATNYLNHYYLVCILALFLVFLPAHRYLSLDNLIFKRKAVTKIPAWMINVIKLQLLIVYFYAGFAKLNADWMIHAMPLRVWLPEHQNMPLLGWIFGWSLAPYIFSWIGAIYDLSIGFLMWNDKTRKWAYPVVIVFHGFTYLLFNIGLFPLIMTLSTLIYFPGETQKRWYERLGIITPEHNLLKESRKQVYLKYLFLIHFIIQVLLPLRHYLYPGKVMWTEEGYRFSWRVMLVEKVGLATFTIVEPSTGRSVEINNSDYLTSFQEKQMSIQSDFMLQYARYLADIYTEKFKLKDVEVYVDSSVALNGRISRKYIDGNHNLLDKEDTFAAKNWILR